MGYRVQTFLCIVPQRGAANGASAESLDHLHMWTHGRGQGWFGVGIDGVLARLVIQTPDMYTTSFCCPVQTTLPPHPN